MSEKAGGVVATTDTADQKTPNSKVFSSSVQSHKSLYRGDYVVPETPVPQTNPNFVLQNPLSPPPLLNSPPKSPKSEKTLEAWAKCVPVNDLKAIPKRISLYSKEITFGRKKTCTVPISDRQVKKKVRRS